MNYSYKPLVSIIIPCYNAERWIAAAIESALGQTYPNIEVIVVDDGSTDGSLDIIKRFDTKINWVSTPNRGPSAAMNTGFKSRARRLDTVLRWGRFVASRQGTFIPEML